MMLRWFRRTGAALTLSAWTVMSCSDDGGSNGPGGGAAPPPFGGVAGSSGGNMAGAGGSAGANAMADEDVSFATDVWPILSVKCAGASCHGDGSFLPQHASSDVNKAYMQAQPVADRIIGRVSGQLTPLMPQNCGPAPGFGACLSLEQVALIREWVEQGAPP